MDLPPWVIANLLVLGAFFAGSVPFGLLIARTKGIDIRAHGSGNIGATNVGRVLGRKYFFICLLLDALKGFAPTLITGAVLGRLGTLDMPADDAGVWLCAMVASVLGHVFCPWLKFKGGKGVSTALGAMLGVFPALTLAAAGALVVWLIALAVWRYISLSGIIAAWALPVMVIAEYIIASNTGRISGPPLQSAVPFLVVTFILALLVVWTHRANIARIRAGTEPHMGQRVRVESPSTGGTP
jgi:glycerol-3-phosphate acyltransferase PlsY